ncbi:MAG TPA: glycine cleavage T C-terminal barrel domain-containing protein [Micropepsaceae bacterium]|nr:glycine cleavage T C-terminal barrel domain-containing protein [Micropepsaceae bacterium]
MKAVTSPTPFHARTAEHNPANAWLPHGAFTIPAHYGSPDQEALAARTSVVMIDVSAQQDLHIVGQGASALLSTACGPAVRGIAVGHSEDVYWCADGGGLRGFGVLSRLADDAFLLRSADADIGWFADAAPRFGSTQVSEETAGRGLLLVTGPYAIALMIAARLEIASLEARRHAAFDWRGLPVTVFRGGRLGGYQIACAAADASLVFDRLYGAGHLVSLRLAGESALQLLYLEAGMPIPHLDFTPAREPFARAPSPLALGFSHPQDAGAGNGGAVLAGLELDSDEPLPFAPVISGSGEVGRTLRSLYSPSLKSAIALAEISPKCASPGTTLTVRQVDATGRRDIAARVVALPFL